MAASETLWPAAVSERSAALLYGTPRTAVVLGSFPAALYLRVGGHASVLPVVARDGLRLPTALAVVAPLRRVGWGVQPGDEVVVGDGDVRLPGATIRAVRTWRPSQVRPATAQSSPGALLAGLRLTWRATARTLTDELLSVPPVPAEVLASRVTTLVGAGPGLTPSADDVLCGILLGLRLGARHPLVDTLWAAVRPRLATTTSLSAALLTEAAQGYAVLPVVRLTRALAAGEATEATEATEAANAVRAVLAIGHSSGTDLLGGLAGCLDALDALDALDVKVGATTVLDHHQPFLATFPRSLP